MRHRACVYVQHRACTHVLKLFVLLAHCFAVTNRAPSVPCAYLCASRSPELVCVFQLVGIALSNSILLHWLLLSAGETFPCPAAQVVSYLGERDLQTRAPHLPSARVRRRLKAQQCPHDGLTVLGNSQYASFSEIIDSAYSLRCRRRALA